MFDSHLLTVTTFPILTSVARIDFLIVPAMTYTIVAITSVAVVTQGYYNNLFSWYPSLQETRPPSIFILVPLKKM